MFVHTLSDMTWEEVRDLRSPNTIAVVPIGAIEAHGPHLPLTTDVIIAEAMARNGAARLAKRGFEVLLLPSMAYTCARFAVNFRGTVSIDPVATSAFVVDLARSIMQQGMGLLAIANAHLDPDHLMALFAGVRRAKEQETWRVAFPNLTQKPWASRLTDEFKSGACHAGRFETSIVLAERPDLVREAIRAKLPPNPASLSKAIHAGKHTFEESGGPDAYFGYPAEATAEEGRRTVDVLGSILEEAVLAEIRA